MSPPDRVEAGRYLVQYQQIRRAEQGLRDAETLLHPFRERLELQLLLARQPDAA
jgi:hypothetical protein